MAIVLAPPVISLLLSLVRILSILSCDSLYGGGRKVKGDGVKGLCNGVRGWGCKGGLYKGEGLGKSGWHVGNV